MANTENSCRFRTGNAAVELMVRLSVATVLVVLCGMLTGCCFERQWQEATRYSYPEQELAGCWEGTWQSDYNGHHGGLRAIITKQGEGYYDAHFHATYAAVIPFEFQLPFLVADDGAAYALQGEADLGWLAGGLYNYNGSATATDFVAAYSAENKDHGTFTMQKKRPCAECCGSGTCGATGGKCGACGR